MELAKRVKSVSASLTLAITAKAKKLRAEGADVVNLAGGEPDFDTPKNVKKAAVSAINDGFTKYTPASGAADLKKAISEKLMKENDLEYDPSCVTISCGAKHALYNIFQAVCQEGDEVIIPSPYWLSYPEMVRLAGGAPVFVEAREGAGFKLDIDNLTKAFTPRTKAVIINSPSNPTGAVYTKDELAEIAELAVSKNVLVVSDEIYEKLIYDGREHISIASLGDGIKKLTLVVNGVSKSYSMTGWRIGYAAGDKEIIDAINKVQSHSTSNPASISQKAALRAISGRQESVEEMRSEFESRRDHMMAGLEGIENFSAVKPGGAFYVFCNIKKTGLDSVSLANALLDELKVAAIPGKPFGSDDHIRLSFATGKESISKGLERIRRWRDQRR